MNSPDGHVAVVKEGYLWKRGEYIKNWRKRYFILKKDGSFLGFRSKPEHGLSDPLHDFTVKDCQLMKQEKPRPHTFLIRGLRWTTIVERMFCVDSVQERDEWIEAIHSVSDNLKVTDEEPTPASLEKMKRKVEMYEERGISYLIDRNDTVLAYEEKGKQTQSPNTSHQDREASALLGMNRIQRIEMVQGYMDMKSQLSEYLKKFAENGKVVREEDIREFFNQMQARERQRTGGPPQYFCH